MYVCDDVSVCRRRVCMCVMMFQCLCVCRDYLSYHNAT